MKLGFVSAILADLALDRVVEIAAELGYSSIEVMCWPPGTAERRYAGVTHIDVTSLNPAKVDAIRDLFTAHNLEISGLGYYPNLLTADRAAGQAQADHLKKIIDAAHLLGVPVVNTFAGRDHTQSIDANWPRFLETWRPLVAYAEQKNIKIGIENCPMSFTRDEWPGGKNLATTPVIWRRMFADIPSSHFGLNFDPSHFVWQHLDYVRPMFEFKDRLFHIHAKDARIDPQALAEHGVLAYPNLWHTPKIPGHGNVNWATFLAALYEAGYSGHVAIEVEDRVFEGSLPARIDALEISRRYLLQFMKG